MRQRTKLLRHQKRSVVRKWVTFLESPSNTSLNRETQNFFKFHKSNKLQQVCSLHRTKKWSVENGSSFKSLRQALRRTKRRSIFLNSIRVTSYSKFAACADKSIDIKLCACTKDQISYVTNKGVLFEDSVPGNIKQQ